MSRAWQDPPEYDGGGASLAMPGMTPLVKRIILINAATFVVGFLWSLASREAWYQVERVFAVSPGLWSSWFPFLPLWQLVTYGFLHSVTSPLHVLMNMLFLYFLGTMLEGIVGASRFLATYLISIVFAGICTLLVGFATGEAASTVGASGGVMAIVVACATLRPHTRIIFIIIPMTLKVFAWLYVGLDLFYGLNVVLGQQRTGVAHFAHLGGALFGFLAVRKGWIWRDPMADLQARRERHAAERRKRDAEHLDELLERIHKEGIHSLSDRERAFLKKASQRR